VRLVCSACRLSVSCLAARLLRYSIACVTGVAAPAARRRDATATNHGGAVPRPHCLRRTVCAFAPPAGALVPGDSVGGSNTDTLRGERHCWPLLPLCARAAVISSLLTPWSGWLGWTRNGSASLTTIGDNGFPDVPLLTVTQRRGWTAETRGALRWRRLLVHFFCCAAFRAPSSLAAVHAPDAAFYTSVVLHCADATLFLPHLTSLSLISAHADERYWVLRLCLEYFGW